MKNWLLAIALVLLGAGSIFYFGYSPSNSGSSTAPTSFGERRPTPAPTSPGEAASTGSTFGSDTRGSQSNAAVSSVEPRLAVQPTPDIPGTLSSNDPERTNLAPEIVIDNMRTAIRGYGSRFGGNPVGNNAEITRALDGDNPKQVKFIRPESGLRINSNGELVDPWGTPFFFHQLSGSQTEIHSAGPDKKMWTADDLVTQ